MKNDKEKPKSETVENPKEQSLATAPCSAIRESEDSRMGRTLFVYASGGNIRCVSVEETRLGLHEELAANGWKHTGTLDPARWIEALMKSDPMTATSMMDELNFGQNAHVQRPADATPNPVE